MPEVSAEKKKSSTKRQMVVKDQKIKRKKVTTYTEQLQEVPGKVPHPQRYDSKGPCNLDAGTKSLSKKATQGWRKSYHKKQRPLPAQKASPKSCYIDTHIGKRIPPLVPSTSNKEIPSLLTLLHNRNVSNFAIN